MPTHSQATEKVTVIPGPRSSLLTAASECLLRQHLRMILFLAFLGFHLKYMDLKFYTLSQSAFSFAVDPELVLSLTQAFIVKKNTIVVN